MNRRELCGLIGLQPEIVSGLDAAGRKVDLPALAPLLTRLTDREAAPEAYRSLAEALGEDPDGLKMLLCQLSCACRVRDTYRQMGIPDEVFADTMGCFARFIGECGRVNGRLGFDRGWWTWRQLSLSLFRLGALEFERRDTGGAVSVAVHIPSDADLSPAAADASLEAAGRFFPEHFGESGSFTCRSWLLSPALAPLLPEGSNILAFQRRFRVLSVDRGAKDFIRWLYEVPEDTPAGALPERTSLQRGVKALLLAGGTVGSAYGILENSSRRTYDHT